MKMKTIALNPMALAVAIAFTASAHAAGTGTIVSGNGSISQNQNHTVVKQNTDKMVINWDNMDVAQKEVLQFVQPGKNSAVLNRINSHDPTQINGALRANGQVFIVNPNGVLINNGASIDVGSLIASSLDIQDSDFMKGNLTFSGNGTGTVSNQGTISAESSVALIGAGEVNNKGTITTVKGGATLAAGEDITLSFPSMGMINVKINKGSLRALVNNGGIIRTPNGSIALTAWATDTLTRSVINNTGTMEADQIIMRTDGIYLENNSSDIAIAGTVAGNTIHASGGNISVKDNSLLKGRYLTILDASKKDGHVEFGKSTIQTGILTIKADNVLAGAEGQGPDLRGSKRIDILTKSNDLVIGDNSAKTADDLIAGKSVINDNMVNSISKSDAVLTVKSNAKNIDLDNANVNYGKLRIHNWSDDSSINIKSSVKGHSLELAGNKFSQSEGADINMAVSFSASVNKDINLNANINANNQIMLKSTQGNISQAAGNKSDAMVVDYSGINIKVDGDISTKYLNINAEKFSQGTKSSLLAKSTNFYGGDFDLSSGKTDLANINMWNAKSLNLNTDSHTNLGDSQLSSDLNVVSTADVSLQNLYIGGSTLIKANNIIGLPSPYGGNSSLVSDKDISLTAKNNINIETVNSMNNVSIKSGGNATLGTLSGVDIDVDTIGSVNLKGLHSGNTLNIAATEDVNFAGDIYSKSDMNISANNIQTSKSWIHNTIRSDGDITFTAKNDINIHDVVAHSYNPWLADISDISMSAKNIITNAITTEGKVKLNAANNILTEVIRYASNIDLNAGGKVQAGDLFSKGGISIAAKGDVNLLTGISAVDNITISGNNINATPYYWGQPVIKGAKNITLNAKNDINVNDIASEPDYWYNHSIGNVYLNGKNVNARSVSTIGDAYINATNRVAMDSIYAENVNITSRNNIDINNVYGLESINAKSTAGRINFDYLGLTSYKNLSAAKGVNINYDENRYQSQYYPWY
ncbi:two-partner secretion domain-containing protein [Erwinia sorbitola]|uniref:Filamentous hemagglutinin N-terminal domain-containing protein n=1 Tax=Erwinia sorbitola TaxID=2681984 RepID=A0A6I6EKD1_9GAMM|nr:filamentous hemagglutinin N-terminal domain-containing protein [Erwinia sorbitola]MTD26984.1 filamentous hemagglutinin N-terminal domain-containing protein [Erwinia sorbitola]QGU88545.1 filamentous hemagglutinin N-terminal domain-containing protein [Erwinia sorbitola]